MTDGTVVDLSMLGLLTVAIVITYINAASVFLVICLTWLAGMVVAGLGYKVARSYWAIYLIIYLLSVYSICKGLE